jgi:uncharacterized repeat protein (TIGR01451 family)
MTTSLNAKRLTSIIAMTVIALSIQVAHAQEKACVVLKTEGQKQESVTDAQGKPATRLASLGKVLPGDEIVWTITATNTCDKPAEKVVVNNNVPEHMVYVADSAFGTGTDIAFSLNGTDFKKANELVVRDADGKTRPARAEDIKSIRWTYSSAFTANAVGFVRYRAKVK